MKKKARFSLSFRKSRNIRAAPGFRNQTMWHNQKTYAAALLLIIGILATPIYTGFAVHNEGSMPSVQKEAAAQKEAVVLDSCTDTDGNNAGLRGTLAATSGGTPYVFEDSCSGTILKEYYCDGTRMSSVLKKCANGCSEGRCVG
ncbi:MAG: hypothetical protein HYT73_03980 [Candidatus Aenigmarchaeota archaeon]|nr:hypothetical protein [Candidatus Aenigmarchaeota archaeon]